MTQPGTMHPTNDKAARARASCAGGRLLVSKKHSAFDAADADAAADDTLMGVLYAAHCRRSWSMTEDA